MSLHLIPDDGAPHALTSECGCDPQLVLVPVGGYRREAYAHVDQTGEGPDEACEPGPGPTAGVPGAVAGDGVRPDV